MQVENKKVIKFWSKKGGLLGGPAGSLKKESKKALEFLKKNKKIKLTIEKEDRKEVKKLKNLDADMLGGKHFEEGAKELKLVKKIGGKREKLEKKDLKLIKELTSSLDKIRKYSERMSAEYEGNFPKKERKALNKLIRNLPKMTKKLNEMAKKERELLKDEEKRMPVFKT